ncbi:MAG: NDP-sugar dehydratase or epimerase [Nitrospinaceae bacterium]|nr:MAG: NDP-sugar dehydratase or epimerase [Nitrospinaceae bacterium]
MRIGVTGASGFIGSHLMDALKNVPEVSVAPLSRKRQNPTLTELKTFVQKKDLIYHLAGINRGSDEEILQGNVLGTLHLLVAIKTFGSPLTRIVFASSSQVYKLGKVGSGIKESRATEPQSLYGVSKKTAEDLIRLSGLDNIILRLSNVYGPGCRPNYNSVIATFCDRAVNNRPLNIDGTGKQGRDFIYIDDVIQAMVLAGTRKQPQKQTVYNISSGRLSTLRQVIGHIKRSRKEVNVEYKNSDDGYSYVCDSSRFQRKYGWKPKTPLSAGIRNILQGLKKGLGS